MNSNAESRHSMIETKTQHNRLPVPYWLLALGLALVLIGFSLQRQALGLSFGLLGDLHDASLYLWHTWWPTYSIGLAETPTFSAYATAPYLQNYLLYAPLLQSLFFSLINLITQQPVLSFNLVLVVGVVVTFFSIVLLARHLGTHPILALGVAGLFTFSTWYIDALRSSDVILASSFGLPLALIALYRWKGKQTLLNALWVGLTLILTLLCGMQQFAGLLGVWLPLGIWLYLTDIRKHTSDEQQEPQMLQFGLMTFLIIAALLIHPLPNVVRSMQGFEAAFSSPELFRAESISLPVALIETVLLPLTAAAAAVVLVGANERRHLHLAVLGFVALLVGQRLIPEPLVVVSAIAGVDYLPIYAPEVLLGPSILMLSMYAGLVFNDWLTQRPSWYAWAGVAAIYLIGILLVVTVAEPVRTEQLVAPDELALLREMDSQPEDYLILHYPSALQDERGASLASVYGVFHQKRLIYGRVPYPEPELEAAYDGLAFLNIEADSALSDEESAQFADAVATWRIGYIILHRDLLDAAEINAIDAAAKQTERLCPAEEVGSLIIYQAQWHPGGC